MSTAITSTADCGDPETTATPTVAIRLHVFAPPLTTAERFSRTLEYVKDPQRYLTDVLGEKTFSERKDVLCISPTYEQDAYGAGGQKTYFEQHIAKVLGKAHGLFFITGVQAQLIALKIHCDKVSNPRVAWHVSAHLEDAEERAYEALYGLERTLIGTNAAQLPTISEIAKIAGLPEDKRPAVILLELPNRVLGCATYTFDELQKISATCHQHGVSLHLDGARLWEIEPYYRETGDKSFTDIVELFDTAYVSFYKGLGGVTGAMLVTNDASMINEAKMWQRRTGGNPYTLTYETIDCERGFNENIGTFLDKWEKMNDVVTQVQAATKSFQTPGGGQVVEFRPRRATCCQIRTVFNGYTAAQLDQAKDGTESKTGIRLFERLLSKLSLDEKLAADRAGKTIEQLSVPQDDVLQNEFEWMIMSMTRKVDTATFVKAYVTICQELQNINA